MSITKEEVEKIAELARLELTREETESFTEQLAAILQYMEKLNELDTTGVEPMSHCGDSTGDLEYAQRDDVVTSSLGQAAATSNAPDHEAGFFKVPKVIGV